MVAGSQVITPTAENAIIRQPTHKTIYAKLVLTTFMLKKRDFILRLCRKSLRGRRFVTRKTTEKNERWTFSPLIKSRADSVQPGRPLFCISASLSSQRCFFYFSLYLVQSEGCTKNNAVRNSPWRILIRAFSEPSRTHLRGNSPLLSGHYFVSQKQWRKMNGGRFLPS